MPDRIYVKRSDDGEVIPTGVGTLRGGRVRAKIGGSDDEVDSGNLTGDWIYSGTDILGSENSGIWMFEYK